ncbi:sensor histidine kinase [Spiractinospora alimapuensis]|uniref:sensor histidine kinase n=1 Tax=Spiractinospora alimapuensis TaxID=2820884 RepID=UPI001F1DF40F|nr:histidine kinase [Spiractinospora alimapuensis]QVQ50645.1 sensor histidine kinase [Spiractinospora alimapuensis]
MSTIESWARRRDVRARLTDTGAFVLALGYMSVWLVILVDDATVNVGVLQRNLVLALLACLALWWRRRWPVGVAAVLVPLAAVADLGQGALIIALFTVAAHRSTRATLTLAGAFLLLRAGLVLGFSDVTTDVAWVLVFSATTTIAAVGWGFFARRRTELMASLRDRAERAETEARLRAEQAQRSAREQVAREIHDVLGHRLSLLSVHAGALEYRPDASRDDVSHAARVIRDSAHAALQDLRTVVGVLRAPVGELPAPTEEDLARLVTETRAAGTPVEFVRAVEGTPPDDAVRAAYRVVQEGLTNVRKHAPGAGADVRLSGSARTGLTVDVTNTPPERPSEPPDTTGQGLLGLTERVTLLDGHLEHGPDQEGGFRLHAWLPWPA